MSFDDEEYDVEFIIAYGDGTWESVSHSICTSDIDESEGIEQGFVNRLAELIEEGEYNLFRQINDNVEISFIGVLHYSSEEEEDNAL